MVGQMGLRPTIQKVRDKLEGAQPLELGQRELEKISNYLNHELNGMSIAQVREKIARELKAERSRYDQLQKQALNLSNAAFETVDAEGLVYVSGTSLMLNQPEFSTPDQMKRIIQTLESKKALIELLDRSQAADGVQIFIGSQSQHAEIEGGETLPVDPGIKVEKSGQRREQGKPEPFADPAPSVAGDADGEKIQQTPQAAPEQACSAPGSHPVTGGVEAGGRLLDALDLRLQHDVVQPLPRRLRRPPA